MIIRFRWTAVSLTLSHVSCSSESKTVVVAFRGTCEPKDLIVDGNVLQTDWVEGVKESEEKVHTGFRTSLESVCMKLKWLIGEACGGEKEIEGWNLKITGHSLGGALAILFCRDVAEEGETNDIPIDVPSTARVFTRPTHSLFLSLSLVLDTGFVRRV